MTVKLSELRVFSSFEAGAYTAGMAQKVAADRAGTASSGQLGMVVTDTSQKIAQAARPAEALARSYISGYAQAAKFEQAIRTLGRGVETGVVPMERVGAILDGIYTKFGRQADAASVAARGYTGLAREVESLNAKLAQTTLSATAAAEASRRLMAGMSGTGAAVLASQRDSERLVAGMGAGNAVPGILRKADADAAAQAAGRVAAGMSSIGRAAMLARMETDRLISGMSSAGGFDAVAARTLAAAEATQRMAAGMHAAGAAALETQRVNERLIRGMSAVGGAIQGAGRQAALSSFAMTNLAYQINDVATMAAMGGDPFRILASQAGQFYQILSMGEGGVKGSLGYLKDVLVGMITPLRLAVGGFALLGATAAAALKAAVDDVNDINVALSGIGAASGQTVASINALALAAAEAGSATVGQARSIAIEFAATGKIGSEVTAEFVGMGRRFAATFGEDMPDAASRMAKALADPAKGVDDLNKRLGVFDDVTRQTIISLATQGRRLEAQSLIMREVDKGLVNHIEATSRLGRAWQHAMDDMSKYWEKLKQGMLSIAEGPSLDDQIAEAKAEYDRLARGSREWPSFMQPDQHELMGAFNKYTGLQAKKSAQEAAKAWEAEQKRINEASTWGADTARRMFPEIGQVQQLTAEAQRLREILTDPKISATWDNFTRAGVSMAATQMDKKAQYLEQAQKNGGVAITMAQEEHRIALATITARSTAQRADVAYLEEVTRLRREGDPEAENRAAMKRSEVITQATEQVRRFNEQRLLSADQSIEASERELSLLGKTTAERERELALLSARQDLENEAFRMEGDRNAYSQRALADIEARVNWQAELNRRIAEEGALRDLAFERDQMGRSAREQAVYSRGQSLGILTDGEFKGTQAELLEGQIRFNEVMKISQDSSKEFFTGFISDMRQGTSATEALANAMNKLADRFLDMAMDSAFPGLLKPFSQAIATGATGVRATDTFGGWGSSTAIGDWSTSVFPAYHRGGVAGTSSGMTRTVHPSVFDGAPRYHTGGIAGLLPNEVPAILEKGERVLPKSGSGGGSVSVPVEINLYAPGADAAALGRLQAEFVAMKRELPALVVNTVRDNRSRFNA